MEYQLKQSGFQQRNNFSTIFIQCLIKINIGFTFILLKINTVHQGDCLELMKAIPDNSVDLILSDLPFQMTNCRWDVLIPFDELWFQFKRLIKKNCAVVLCASQPFTSALVMSNLKDFKYEWIWEKPQGTNFLNAKKQPLKNHESVLVFCPKGTPKYFPQMTTGKPYTSGKGNKSEIYNYHHKVVTYNEGSRYPKTVQKFNPNKGLHPTQKPLAMFEYFIETYSKPGDLVLDCVAGSFTTAVACDNLNRNWICIEKEEKYCQIGIERIAENKNSRISNPGVCLENRSENLSTKINYKLKT